MEKTFVWGNSLFWDGVCKTLTILVQLRGIIDRLHTGPYIVLPIYGGENLLLLFYFQFFLQFLLLFLQHSNWMTIPKRIGSLFK